VLKVSALNSGDYSQLLLAENVRDIASKIAKIEHKIATYKMA